MQKKKWLKQLQQKPSNAKATINLHEMMQILLVTFKIQQQQQSVKEDVYKNLCADVMIMNNRNLCKNIKLNNDGLSVVQKTCSYVRTHSEQLKSTYDGQVK